MNSFPLPAVRSDPTEKEPVKDNTSYTAKQIRGWLRNWHYLAEGKFPPDDRAPDPRARGRVSFESKPPAPAVIVFADLNRAIDALPPTLKETVLAVAKWGNFGEAGRLLRRRKKTVMEDYDAAIPLMVLFLGNETPAG